MDGTDPGGRTHTQPTVAPVGALGPTTLKPDKSLDRHDKVWPESGALEVQGALS
jgi:hypothetical protein